MALCYVLSFFSIVLNKSGSYWSMAVAWKLQTNIISGAST